MHAQRNPDGTFTIQGETFRLEEDRANHFYVCALKDGARVGGFAFGDGATLEIDEGSGEVVHKIATMLATPRGVLPLQ